MQMLTDAEHLMTLDEWKEVEIAVGWWSQEATTAEWQRRADGLLERVSSIVANLQEAVPNMQTITDAEHLMLKQLEAIVAQLQRIVVLLERLARP